MKIRTLAASFAIGFSYFVCGSEAILLGENDYNFFRLDPTKVYNLKEEEDAGLELYVSKDKEWFVYAESEGSQEVQRANIDSIAGETLTTGGVVGAIETTATGVGVFLTGIPWLP